MISISTATSTIIVTGIITITMITIIVEQFTPPNLCPKLYSSMLSALARCRDVQSARSACVGTPARSKAGKVGFRNTIKPQITVRV